MLTACRSDRSGILARWVSAVARCGTRSGALVPITRNGRREEVYWTYSYGPIDDSTAPSGVGGVLVVCSETTTVVIAERQRTDQMLRQRRLFEQALAFIIVMRGPEHIVDFLNDAHREVFGSDNELRNPLAPIRNALQIARSQRSTDSQRRWSHDPLIDSRAHRLVVRLPSEPVWVSADALWLAQVVSNLLTNAAKYSEPHGTIHLDATLEGTELVIRVADEGIGIEPHMLSRIFEMFAQGKSAVDQVEGGLGIGLSLVKGLVACIAVPWRRRAKVRTRAVSTGKRILVLDIGMPHMKGHQTATELRKRAWAKKAVFVAVTGWGQPDDRRRSLDAGFDHHLVKPVDPMDLRALLEAVRVPSDP
jgi:CheY-like chemotaxis protein